MASRDAAKLEHANFINFDGRDIDIVQEYALRGGSNTHKADRRQSLVVILSSSEIALNGVRNEFSRWSAVSATAFYG